MTALDLGPATRATADLVRGVRDDQLGAATPCPAYDVGDLLDHLHGLARAFTAAADKDLGEMTDSAPEPDGSALPTDWRDAIPGALDRLAEAWRTPGATDGVTRAGGVDLPGEVALLVALDEVVVHGWDLARATDQAYDPDAASVEASLGFARSFSPEGEGPFGPPVAVVADAPALDRLAGATGRDPRWTP
ncbi:TIGR03086 family metal-binding protein [Nocardioides aestuarii]|uniref:TIGR03086 family metal-binding protein n=1 Tax=Nocardioides aestuarii TaxID=252231 RepID=A0ABW4TP86_9ACTN